MEYISSYEARICKAKNKKEKAKRKKGTKIESLKLKMQ